MKKIRNAVAAIAVMLATLAMPTGAVSAAVACPSGSVRTSAPTAVECNVEETDRDVWDISQTIINVIIAVLGIVAVIVIVLGGVNFVMSQGDPAKTKKAKDTILYGIIGLVVALLAYAIVNFVLASLGD
ncbi:hypothetical protein IJG73_00780 [Candidatus Saccharibacteria bacterium]|nr:hypothetical protein [Candidatus Saccharibacteria bacterium]